MKISNFKFLISKPSFLFFYILLIAGLSFAARLLPHFPNFTPVGALALFVGAYTFKKYWWSLFVPLFAMFLSDLVIGFYDFKLMAVVYGSFFAYAFFGMLVSKKRNFQTMLLGSVGGAVFFYLTTNFAVWLFSSELFYPHTIQGLMMSYTLALPFFKYTILGDIFFTCVFFGAYEFVRARVFSLRDSNERVMGIEPTCPDWQPGALPLCYTRISSFYSSMCRERESDPLRQPLQGCALPMSYRGLKHLYRVGGVGFGPTASSV